MRVERADRIALPMVEFMTLCDRCESHLRSTLKEATTMWKEGVRADSWRRYELPAEGEFFC